MRDLKVFAVVDKEAKIVCSVFTADTKEQAERSFFTLLAGTHENVFTLYPEQFDLHHVANLIYDGGVLKVIKPGSEALVDSAFNVDHFKVIEPLKAGSSYPKAYLKARRDELREYYEQRVIEDFSPGGTYDKINNSEPARAQEEEVSENE